MAKVRRQIIAKANKVWLRYLKLIAYNHRWSSKINFAYTLHWLQKRAAIISHLKEHTFEFLNFYQIYWYWFLTHVQKYLVLKRSKKLLLDLYYIEKGVSFDFFPPQMLKGEIIVTIISMSRVTSKMTKMKSS